MMDDDLYRRPATIPPSLMQYADEAAKLAIAVLGMPPTPRHAPPRKAKKPSAARRAKVKAARKQARKQR